LINAVFLRPVPVKDPSRLAQVFTVMPKSSAYQTLSLPNYRDFRDNVAELSGLAAYNFIGANLVGGTEPVAMLTLLGVSIGLAAAFAVTRLIASLLFVSPTDGLTFTAINALLAAVAMLASLLPARRAARVDPLVALRQEC
jgi:hypothetical protein